MIRPQGMTVMGMLNRDRVLMALNHEEPDRVPIDLASTPVSGICRGAYADLLAHRGLDGREIRIIDLAQQLAGVDDDILAAFEVDFRPISSNPPAGYRPEIFDEGEYEAYFDEWGVKRRRPPPIDPAGTLASSRMRMLPAGPISGMKMRQSVSMAA